MIGAGLVLALAVHAACSPAALNDRMKKDAHDAKGKLSVSARILDDHPSESDAGARRGQDSTQRYSFHGGRKAPMQSVYKLPIVVVALQMAQDRKLDLAKPVHVTPDDFIPPAGHSPLRDTHPKGDDFTVRELLRRAIVDSDGSASDIVLQLIGGTKAVRRSLKQQKVKGIRVMHTEAQLIDDAPAQYSDSAKADEMVEFLARLQRGKLLNADNTRMLRGWMTVAESGNERIRAKLPKGTVADKTGSSGTYDGSTPATNDVGLVAMPGGKQMAIAIFLTDAKADVVARNALIADVAHEIWSCWAEGQ
ncbi:MAG TPA: class A beta-lactamase [Candidatus Koribacter sp.]|jgi:beta-lactamase class A